MNATLRSWLASAGAMRRVLSTFAPYIGAGIRVTHIAEDFSSARVEMGQHWYNTNYVGTHFGGSLYSMVDPMYMLLLMRRLAMTTSCGINRRVLILSVPARAR